VLQALEAEGWMKILCPAWTSTKAEVARLNALHDLSVELLMQGVHSDISAAQMQLLTAKMAPKDLNSLKKSLLRPGFVEEWNNLDHLAAGFAKVLTAKDNQTPSAMFKLFTSYDPEAVLWLGFTTKDAGIKQRYNNFLKVWPEMRQQIPYALMLEMRIRPELPNYNDIVHAIFLQLIDGKLTTPEEMRAFLEPYSPPAPPPQISIKRTRAKRAAGPKVKEPLEDEDEESIGDVDLDDMGEDDETGLGLPKMDLESDTEDEEEEDEAAAEEDEEDAVPVKRGKASAKSAKPVPVAAPVKGVPPAKTPAPAAPKPAPVAANAAKAEPTPKAAPPKAAPAKPAPAKAAPAKPAAKPVKAAAHPPAKKAPAKAVARTPVKKATLKPAAKAAHKSVPKAAKAAQKSGAKAKSAKPAPRPAPKAKPHKPAKPAKAAKPVAMKPVARKPAAKKASAKPVKKR
jgi:tRNA nucleotidyltransferase (CCA-adding enzyme)